MLFFWLFWRQKLFGILPIVKSHVFYQFREIDIKLLDIGIFKLADPVGILIPGIATLPSFTAFVIILLRFFGSLIIGIAQFFCLIVVPADGFLGSFPPTLDKLVVFLDQS